MRKQNNFFTGIMGMLCGGSMKGSSESDDDVLENRQALWRYLHKGRIVIVGWLYQIIFCCGVWVY